MEEIKTSNSNTVDYAVLFRKVWNKKRLFIYKVWPITFVLSCTYILGVPRYYTSVARLAPELGGTGMEGSIASVASSLGFDLSGMQTTDAISPLLYPDLMEDDGFVTGLFNIKVESEDGDINTTYHDYLVKHQKQSLWSYPMSWLSDLLKSKKNYGGKGDGTFNPYHLPEDEHNVAEAIRGNIQLSINDKTGVISVNTKAQDALICKTLSDSVCVHLQNFITAYRTNKARVDYEYYKELAATAKRDYETVRQQYARMADANTQVSLRSVELKVQDIESDMQLKFNAYTTINNQLEAAKAKVQERTPAFTVIKGASVPIKPAGPKRMLFVAFMLLLATMVTITVILRKDLKKIMVIHGN